MCLSRSICLEPFTKVQQLASLSCKLEERIQTSEWLVIKSGQEDSSTHNKKLFQGNILRKTRSQPTCHPFLQKRHYRNYKAGIFPRVWHTRFFIQSSVRRKIWTLLVFQQWFSNEYQNDHRKRQCWTRTWAWVPVICSEPQHVRFILSPDLFFLH